MSDLLTSSAAFGIAKTKGGPTEHLSSTNFSPKSFRPLGEPGPSKVPAFFCLPDGRLSCYVALFINGSFLLIGRSKSLLSQGH
jgi:hypothetical protein